MNNYVGFLEGRQILPFEPTIQHHKKGMKMSIVSRTRKKSSVILKIMLITIVFTSGDAFAWTRSSNFDSGSAGQNAIGTSGFDYAGRATTYSTDFSVSGTKSAKMLWTQGSEGFAEDHGEYSIQTVPNGGNIWIRGYFYFPSGFDFTASPVSKFIRLKLSTGGYVSLLFNANVPSTPNVGKLIVGNDSVAYNWQQDIQNSAISTGSWHCVEMHLRLSTTAPILRAWLDGNLVYNDTSNVQVLSGTNANLIYIMTNWNGGVPKTQSEYMDDIVITTDTPSQVDSKGNSMIGPISGSPSAAPSSPTGLRVTAS